MCVFLFSFGSPTLSTSADCNEIDKQTATIPEVGPGEGVGGGGGGVGGGGGARSEKQPVHTFPWNRDGKFRAEEKIRAEFSSTT